MIDKRAFRLALVAAAVAATAGCASNGQLQDEVAKAQATAEEALMWAKNAKYEAVEARGTANAALKAAKEEAPDPAVGATPGCGPTAPLPSLLIPLSVPVASRWADRRCARCASLRRWP